MSTIEKLREKSFREFIPAWEDRLNGELQPRQLIPLSDAEEICKNLYTKEQVEELLKKQRVICADIAHTKAFEMLNASGDDTGMYDDYSVRNAKLAAEE